MTASLPADLQAVFDRFITTELTTISSAGQPITWPVTPYYSPGAPCIDVTTGLAYPKKAHDARANLLVSLLFSDPTGSGLDSPPMVLVQGSAEVDDGDLEANRKRYARESLEKLPEIAKLTPPEPLRRMLNGELIGMPLQPGLACLTAHGHAERFSWQQNFQVRGDLAFMEGRWALIPRRLVGGFEVPRSRLALLRANAAKAARFHKTAKRELAQRS